MKFFVFHMWHKGLRCDKLAELNLDAPTCLKDTLNTLFSTHENTPPKNKDDIYTKFGMKPDLVIAINNGREEFFFRQSTLALDIKAYKKRVAMSQPPLPLFKTNSPSIQPGW